MTTSSHAAAAAQIRAEMKRHGVKGRVRSSRYAGGTSVRVELDDPLPATIRKVEQFASRFQYGHFDGMTDSYDYSNHDDDLPQVKFVFVDAVYSPETRAEADKIANDWGVPTSNVLRGWHGDLWTQRKPRVAA